MQAGNVTIVGNQNGNAMLKRPLAVTNLIHSYKGKRYSGAGKEDGFRFTAVTTTSTTTTEWFPF
jgi:hypothetical protein